MDYKDHEKGLDENNFWFRGKNRLIDVLMRKVARNKGKDLKILNIGAGTGNDLKVLNKYGRNYIVDINKKALDMVNKEMYAEKKVADVCKLPFKDDFFDIVVSFDVFEHIEDDKKAFSEVYRVLKKEGVLLFTVPAFQSLFSGHDRALEHKRRYGGKELKKKLKSFRELRIGYWNSLMFFPIALMRIMNKKSEAKVDNTSLPGPINQLFYFLLTMDNVMIAKGFSMPFGLSIVGWCRK